MASWSNMAKRTPKPAMIPEESNMVSLKLTRKVNKTSNSPMLPNLPTSLDLPATASNTSWANAEPFVMPSSNSKLSANAEPFLPAAIHSQKKENAANMNSYLKEINMKRNLNRQNTENMNSYLKEINNVRKVRSAYRKSRKSRSASRKVRSTSRKASRKNRKGSHRRI